MGKRSLIAVVAGVLLMSAPGGSWADVTVQEESVTVPEDQRVTGVPAGSKAVHLHRVFRGGITPEDVRPQYITGYGYAPFQIRDAYGFGTLLTNGVDGTGQTIAIIDAYGSSSIASDLAAFSSQYSLPSATLNIYYPGGYPTTTDADWAFETSLDVEWVHALAPGATIALVIAPSNSYGDLLTAVQYAAQTLNAQVVSMSWGTDEFSYESNYDSVFQHTGTVFIAASGDSGSGAQLPASSKYVVAVGGTSLYLTDNTGTRKFPEVAWEESGGGTSSYVARPGYQTSFGISASKKRCIPDVAFAGDPYTGILVYDSNYDPSTGNWWVAGGTSLSAQSWAAIIGLADQLRAASGLATLTDGHHALYTLAGSKARFNTKGYYLDITWGYNGNYAAAKGWDFITGLGSPNATSLVPALAAFSQ